MVNDASKGEKFFRNSNFLLSADLCLEKSLKIHQNSIKGDQEMNNYEIIME